LLKSPYFRRLLVPYLVLIVVAVVVVGLGGAHRLRATYVQTTEDRLRDDTRLVSQLLAPHLGNPQALQEAVRELSRPIGCRITVIQRDGRVLADSRWSAGAMHSHRDRPEVIRALAGGEGIDVRASDTVHVDMLYLARRLDSADQTYVVRLAIDLAELRHHLRAMYLGLGMVGALAIVAAGIICYWFARRHARPVLELAGFAQALSSGQLQRRTVDSDKGEIGTLASSLNTVAHSMSSLVQQVEKDKLELLTILASMSEGVIATDAHQRVVLVNQAAGELLGFAHPQAQGKLLCELVPQEKVLKVAQEVLADGLRRTCQIGPISGRYLEVISCTYPSGGDARGLLLVLHDNTQAVRYQDLRKEFVANVSHELRTPLTVIKGFVETLLDSAQQDPSKTQRYLATIGRHTQQLCNLVGDLLEISRIESQPDLPRRTEVDLGPVIKRAVELLVPAAQSRAQSLAVEVSPSLPRVIGNTDYLERAISNLVDNAIKYTPEGGRITVRGGEQNGFAVVEVADTGIGIPAEDLPRIFERFYRVDRSRSREMGGTGLGLSIVKHIAQAHGGSVEVQSTPGAGSTFRLRVPLALSQD